LILNQPFNSVPFQRHMNQNTDLLENGRLYRLLWQHFFVISICAYVCTCMSCVLLKDLKRFAQILEKEGCLRFARILDIKHFYKLGKNWPCDQYIPMHMNDCFLIIH
jgi:hypothetical protein